MTRMGEFKHGWMVFLFLLFFGTGNDLSFIKTPIFWKNVSVTDLPNNQTRRLHDYLSIIPTYGDSKRLGYKMK